jgi:nicotinate-nucleotide adenylyltransferase
MAQKLKRIGIFGGSFDPPHVGHLVIAEMARRALKLDAVFLVPAYQPPHKDGSHASTARDRLAMTKLSVLGNPGLRVYDLELRRKGISYTIDTVRAFRKRFSSSELFLIIGSDSLRQFDTWKSPAEILAEATLLVYRRPRSGRPNAGLHSRNVSFIKGPSMEISSSDIRKRIQRGKSIRYLVRDNVRQFIEKRKIYSDTRQARS